MSQYFGKNFLEKYKKYIDNISISQYNIYRLKERASNRMMVINMIKSNIKKAIITSFHKMYDIASVTVNIEDDEFNEKYKRVIAVIVEKDMTVKKLVFSTYFKTCYEYTYVADVASRNEYEWMYERFARNLEIIEIVGII